MNEKLFIFLREQRQLVHLARSGSQQAFARLYQLAPAETTIDDLEDALLSFVVA